MGRRTFGMPNGWFPVAYSDELAVGELRSTRYFDRALTVVRNREGRASVRDEIGPRADERENAWPVVERNGFVLVWHHAERREPDFEIPAFPEWDAPDWTTRYLRRSWRVRAHPQQVTENAIDWEHLSAVHGTSIPLEKAEAFEDKVMRWAVGGNRYVAPLAAPRDDALVHAESWGLGFSWLRYNGMFATAVATGVTPIDHESVEIRLGVLGKRDGRTDAATNEGLEAYLEGQAAAVERDVAIWERTDHAQAAEGAAGDGVIAEFRRWARQFYSDREAAPAAPLREDRNG